MAEPKKRLTSARSGARRSHLYKKNRDTTKCPKCHSFILPHHICQTCGFYKGKDILNLEAKSAAKEKRRKERQAEENEESK